MTLNMPVKKSPHPIAIAPFGPCCVGKTTTMTYLAEQLPFVHLNHDEMRVFIHNQDVPGDPNDMLYNHLLIIRLAEKYLEEGYSIIVDRDFGTNNKYMLDALEEITRALDVKLFLMKITAPETFIREKVYTRYVYPKQGGVPDGDTGWSCYTYAITHYQKNYEQLAPRAVATVDTSQQLSSQLIDTIKFLRKEMGI